MDRTRVLGGSAPIGNQRLFGLSTFDSRRGKLFVFGGGGNDLFDDAWEWDSAGGSWTNRTPAALPASWPKARYHHAVAYDAARDRMVLFGGCGLFKGILGDTWEWDSGAGTWLERPTLSSKSPSPRHDHALAYDESRQTVILFGGESDQTVELQDLWEWDDSKGQWIDRTPPPGPKARPSPRGLHAMAYDAIRRRIVVFGGHLGQSILRDIWEWDGAIGTWSDRTSLPSANPWPTGRALSAMAFDVREGGVILFGGSDLVTRFSDLWDWNGALSTWTNRTPSPLPKPWPSARVGHGLVSDPTRGRLILFGGYDGIENKGDIWEWPSSQ